MSSNYIHTHIGEEGSDLFRSVFYKSENNHYDEKTGDGSGICPIYIKLKPNAIDFSYFERNLDAPMMVRREVAWFTLPLSINEQTDYFLLNCTEKELDIKVNDNSFRLYYADNNRHFPNLQTLNNKKYIKCIGIREVLLCLFDDLNSPLSDLYRHTTPETLAAIRSRLNESEVYNLIWRKYSFYRAVYDYEANYRHSDFLDEVKVRYIEFLPKLLDGKIYDEIEPEQLNKKNWILNPEEELERLAEINAEYNIDKQTNKRIENTFLKNHAVLSALKLSTGKMYIPIVACMLLSFGLFLGTWGCWLSEHYERTTWLWTSACAFAGLSVMLSTTRRRSRANFTNLLMPRILVAVGTAVLALNITEELYINMVNVEKSSILLLGTIVGAVVAYFLYSESRQHSPAYQTKMFYKRRYNIKITPILIYTFCMGNVFTFVVHLSLAQDKFIGDNDFATKHFSEQLDSIHNIKSQYDEYYNLLSQAYAYGSSWTLLNAATGSKTNNYDSEGKFQGNSSSTGPSGIVRNRYLAQYKNYRDQLQVFRNMEPMKTDVKERKVVIAESGITLDSLLTAFTNKSYIKSDVKKDTIGSDVDALHKAKETVNAIRLDIMKNIITYNNNDTLAKMLTYPNHTPTSNTEKYFEHKKDVLIISPFKFKKLKIYQRLLMIQVIMAMFIGIVGQLIVSDKSVTEPL